MATHTLQPLPPADQSRIATLWHYQGDVVSFMTATNSDPHEMLLWLAQPHIQPWLETIAAAFRTRRETSASDALTRSLADLNKVLDLDAGPTLRIRAVNSIIKLAHAIYRGTRLTPIHANLRKQLQSNADADLAAAKDHALRLANDSLPPEPQIARRSPPGPLSPQRPALRLSDIAGAPPTPRPNSGTSALPVPVPCPSPLTLISLPHHEDPADPLAPRNWPSQNPTYDLTSRLSSASPAPSALKLPATHAARAAPA